MKGVYAMENSTFSKITSFSHEINSGISFDLVGVTISWGYYQLKMQFFIDNLKTNIKHGYFVSENE